MGIKVYKIADIVGDHIAFRNGQLAIDTMEFFQSLTSASDPTSAVHWRTDLIVGKGAGARKISVDLPPLPTMPHSTDHPGFVGEDRIGRCLFLFQNRLYASERPARNANETNEISLRIRQAVYEEDADISNLRSAVANLEAALEYQKSGPRRDAIPEDVKLRVWARDGGACVRCASQQGLQFDHIIPVALGGGTAAANIQILCQTCNLRKSDKIAPTS